MSDNLIGRGLIEPLFHFAVPGDGMSPKDELRTIYEAAKNGSLEDFIIAMGMDLDKVQKDHLAVWERTRAEMLANESTIKAIIDSPEKQSEAAAFQTRFNDPHFTLSEATRNWIPDLDICSAYLTPIENINELPRDRYRKWFGKVVSCTIKKGAGKGRTRAVVVVRPRKHPTVVGL